MAEHSGAMLSARYARQSILPEVGEGGQERLAAVSVAVVGAGGLGCAVLAYLSAAGVGHLTILDADRIEESNLHRQPLYRMIDIGIQKAPAAKTALLALNPHIKITAIAEHLKPANAADVVAAADLVVDATDSLAATYILSDQCYKAGKVLVTASVLGFSGYTGAFCGGGPSYRALFPDMPYHVGSCAQSGVLGTAVGVIGTLQAHITLALLLHLDPAPLARIMTVDFRTLRHGGFSFAGAEEPNGPRLTFIDPLDTRDTDIVIDLRSLEEAPISPIASARRLSTDSITNGVETLPPHSRIVLCCRSGVRAWRAARTLQHQGYSDLALVAFGE